MAAPAAAKPHLIGGVPASTAQVKELLAGGRQTPAAPPPQPGRKAPSSSASPRSTGRPRLSTTPVFPGSAVQVRDVPVVGTAVSGFEGAHWVYQLAAIFLILYIGLAVYARISGRSYQLGWGWGAPPAPPAVTPTASSNSQLPTSGGPAVGFVGGPNPLALASMSGVTAMAATGAGAPWPQLQRMSQFNPARVALS